MTTFVIALLTLIVGYFVYGSFVERVFRPDAARKTPCYTAADGADYIPMPTWKVFTVQFLNICMWLYERSHSGKSTMAAGAASATVPYNKHTWLIAFFPAVFMLAVSSSFIMIAPEGFRLPHAVGYAISAVITIGFSALFLWAKGRRGSTLAPR